MTRWSAAISSACRSAAWSRPHDVAAMVVFLLSPMGDNLSGQSLGVDGNVESL